MAVNEKSITLREIFSTVKEKKIRFIDLKFPDLFGSPQHTTFPIEVFNEDFITKGIGFDGSSIRGFQQIHESDMLIKPDPASMFIDPFFDDPTISFICNITDPSGQKPYSRDSRAVAQKAERYLEASGMATSATFGPELEFFIFDSIRFSQSINEGYYHIDSEEGPWNTGRNDSPNLGYRPRRKGGYFPASPVDSYQNLRSKMVRALMDAGVKVEVHHHEVGGGQSEIGIRFATMVKSADNALKYKYIIKNVAHRYNKTVTFMPKPLFEENGSGMHVNISLWKHGKNMFYQSGRYADLSETAVYFIGGLLQHAPALCAFCAPTTNSYRRLVPGYEAPINLVYSQRNRSACVRIPMSRGEKSKRVEFRTPDPSSNPYLAFASVLMAGVDGIINRIQPPDPIDRDIYELAHDPNAPKIRNTPGTLGEAINALEKDHEFLLRGGVFPEDLIEMYIDYKRENEITFLNLRPHPGEFYLYFDI
jgi:glutamine synthetase